MSSHLTTFMHTMLCYTSSAGLSRGQQLPLEELQECQPGCWQTHPFWELTKASQASSPELSELTSALVSWKDLGAYKDEEYVDSGMQDLHIQSYQHCIISS